MNKDRPIMHSLNTTSLSFILWQFDKMPIRFSCFPLQNTFLLNKFAFLFRYQTETDKSFLTLKYWNQNRFENLKTDQLFS